MKIFRQDKIELTRSDRTIIIAYLICQALWMLFRSYSNGDAWLLILPTILLASFEVILTFFVLKRLIEYFFLRHKYWALGFVCVILGLIAVGATTLLLDNLIRGHSLARLFRPFGQFLVTSMENSLLDVAILIGFVFSKKSYDQLVNNRNLAIENRENALKILRAQFSPHFLYNNLNTIDALIDDQPAIAKEYANRLAALYRYLSDTTDQDIVPLEDELTFIRNYLFLIEVRYGKDYRFDIQVSQPTTNRFLPSGALQTVVENVVKHNAVRKSTLQTTITVADEVVQVRNEKGHHANQPKSGTGLQNLLRRYELLGAPPVNISDAEEHFTVSLPLIPVTEI